MAPPPRTLPDDLIPEILLRLPPDDPAGLVRASAVCKGWRCIITDAAFPGRYRALHPTAPVLGFLHNPSNRKLPRFVSTTSFRPSDADHRRCHALDCRHGHAVFYDYGSLDPRGVLGSYVVWDPATGERHSLPDVPDVLTRPAVVCAAATEGCDDDHRGCSGGPFIVAFVGVENIPIPESHYFDAHACFYASDTGEWSVHINIHLDHGRYNLDDRPAALVGDSLYFFCRRRGYCGTGTASYAVRDIISAGIRERDVLSMMELPREKRLGIGNGKNTNVVVMAAEGGGLGLACLCPKTGTMLYLLAREETESTAGDDDGRWVQRRVIDLKTLLPVGNLKRQPCLSGVAQDANVIFVSTEDGVFTIELVGSSLQLQARKVCEMGRVVDSIIYPFVSFYTESLL
ncbi:LOW QUALITY PROTEIN: hypothetical protein SORBI_3006G081900, partial [Sorghum bicolor]